MVDAQGALLSVVLLDAAIAGLVVGGFWFAVTMMRIAGRKIGYSTESTVQQPFMRGLVGWVR